MAAAVQRIVVQTTAQDKKAIVSKAKKLDISVSELMRRGAFAYELSESDDELGALADAVQLDRLDPDGFLGYQARAIQALLRKDFSAMLRISEAWVKHHQHPVALAGTACH